MEGEERNDSEVLKWSGVAIGEQINGTQCNNDNRPHKGFWCIKSGAILLNSPPTWCGEDGARGARAGRRRRLVLDEAVQTVCRGRPPVDRSFSRPRSGVDAALSPPLQDTRAGLDYAVRRASDARQELDSARQFYLATRTNTPASVAAVAPSVTAIVTDASSAPFRIRSSAAASSIAAQPTHTVQTQPLAVYPAVSPSGLSYGERQRPVAPVPRPPTAGVNDTGSNRPPPSNEGGTGTERQGSVAPRVSPLKRPGRGISSYLVPPKRFKYPRAFKWADNKMHHFPEDFKIPVCSLASMWQFWLCGDDMTKYPPFRIVVASELQEAKTRRMLSLLRFVMLEIESRVLEQDAWVDKPSRSDAVKMLDTVRESIGVRPRAKRGERHPVEDLQWTSLDRILRVQKRMQSEEEGEEEI